MFKNRLVWAMMLGLLSTSMLGAEMCGKKANEKIKSAEAAIEDARLAEAPQYAPNEFQSAEEHLSSAQGLFKKWNFPKSEEEAATAEAQALLAKQIASEEKRRQDEELARLRELQRDSLDSGSDLSDQARMYLKDVNFDFDSPQLSPTAKSVLASNAAFLQRNPSVRVRIEGHCDERGTDEYNLALGAKRAKAVYEYLVSQGVSASRMETISYGESLPLVPGNSESSWSSNRRAHFSVP
jgi:peptidoglycan-associated lipoprotein